MAEQGPAGNKIAPLRNVALLVELYQRLKERRYGLPGVGVFHGFSGYGKSTALAHLAIHYDALVVQCLETDSRGNLLESMLSEAGIGVRGNAGVKLRAVAAHLAQRDRVLIIDDAQYMVAKRYVGVARDIYEASQAPIILVGEEVLPQALQAWENVAGRVLNFVPAQPATVRDAALLAPIYAPGIAIAPDLLEALVARSQGSARVICNNLSLIAEQALVRGASAVALADVDLTKVHTGEPPDIRHRGSALVEPIRKRRAREAVRLAAGGAQ